DSSGRGSPRRRGGLHRPSTSRHGAGDSAQPRAHVPGRRRLYRTVRPGCQGRSVWWDCPGSASGRTISDSKKHGRLPMKTIKLGNANIEVSTACMGTDLIGSRIGHGAAFELLDLFRENGGTFIDTGNFYSAWLAGCLGGESETTIGRWMKERRVRDQ